MNPVVAAAIVTGSAVAVVAAVVPRRPSLAALHRHLYAPPAPAIGLQRLPSGATVGRLLARTELGERVLASHTDSLRVLQLTAGEALTRVAAAGAAGMGVVTAIAVAGHLAGFATIGLPVLGGLVLGGVVGGAVGLRNVEIAATARRRALRQGFAAYLNLVTVLVAAGSGVERALEDAAAAGDGPAFDLVARAVIEGAAGREGLPAAFERAGHDGGFEPLEELGGRLRLALAQGAPLRASVAATASALRHGVLTDLEGDAQEANVRMTLPIMTLAASLIAWMGFPFVTNAFNAF